MNVDCYQNAIGLARQQCPCQPEAPEGYNTSRSGLYLADIAPLSEIGNYNDCSPGGVWDVLDNSRTQAVTTFIGDASALLMKNNKMRRQPWKGGLGTLKTSGVLVTGSAFQGLRICGAGIRGGEMVIDAIGTQFMTGGTFDVTFYDWQGNVVAVRSVTAIAGKHNLTTLVDIDGNPAPVTLPLFDDFCVMPQYYAVYDTALAPVPVGGQVVCGCGGTHDYYYNYSSPIFRPTKSRNTIGTTLGNGWANWLMLGGWKGDDVDFQDVPDSAENQNFGLTLHATLDCKVYEVMCEGELNFSKPLSMSLAYAIQYKAAEIALQNILSTTQINRFQITNREMLEKRRNELRNKYNEHLQYITTNIDLSANDCLDCQAIVTATMRGVFA